MKYINKFKKIIIFSMQLLFKFKIIIALKKLQLCLYNMF